MVNISILKKISAVAFCCAVAACTVDDMRLSYQHSVQVSFYSSKTKADTTLNNFSATGIGAAEGKLYDDVSKLHQAFLNTDLNATAVKYILENGSLKDTVGFWYSVSLEPVSGSGGITAAVHLDSVKSMSKVFIDSISLVYPDVKYNESKENVKIFIY